MSVDITQYIRDYVDDLFGAKIAEYRFNPTQLTSTFKYWGERYLTDYKDRAPLLASTFRDFLEVLDTNYEYQQTQELEALLDRVKWVTPVPGVEWEAGEDRAIACAVTNLVLTGAGVLPTVTANNPINPAFNLATHIMEGSWALNATDNKWYYRVGDTIKSLAQEATIAAMNANIVTANQDIRAVELRVDDVEGDISSLQNFQSAITTYLTNEIDPKILLYDAHLADDTGIHALPDGVTIIINGDGELEAQAQSIDLSAVTDRLDALEASMAQAEQDIEDLQGGSSIDLSDYVRKNPEGGATQQINGRLIVNENIYAAGNIAAHAGARA